MDLSRVDRVLHTIDPAKLAATGLTITGVTVAVLPVGSKPTGSTTWTALTSYTAPTTAKIRLAGPDADSTAALVVTADADLWALVTDGTQTEAVKIERLAVQGSSGTIAALPVPFVTSVQGRTGAVTLTASDVGADASGAATAAQAAAIAAIPSMSTIAADPALRAAFVLPMVGGYTYNTDGTVASGPAGETYAYNSDGTVHSVTLNGTTRTYTYNADGSIASAA